MSSADGEDLSRCGLSCSHVCECESAKQATASRVYFWLQSAGFRSSELCFAERLRIGEEDQTGLN